MTSVQEAVPDAPPGPKPLAPGPLRRPAGRRLGLLGTIMVTGLVAVAAAAPLVARHDPDVPTGLPFQPPSTAHPLGTNDIGQDLLAQVIYGARVSLAVGFLAAAFAVGFGLAVALVAGYRRGRVEAALMRVVDVMLAFPFLVLVIVLSAFFGRGLATTVTVIAAVIWARPARVLRSQVLKVREFGHVVAAQAMGLHPARVIGVHILPRVAPLAAAQFVRAANVAVMIEASLAFLGLGDPTRPSWGTILHFASVRNAILTEAWPWWILPPGLALTVAVVGLAFVGYAVEERVDPRLASGPRPRPSRAEGKAAPAPGLPDAPALHLRDLVVEYSTPRGVLRAVDGVSLCIERGSVVGLVGESGSGKTTLALALLGLHRPPARIAGGGMALGGVELGRPRRAVLSSLRGRRVALIPQSAMHSLNPAYPVRRQVTEAAALTRSDSGAAARRAEELLDAVGIPAARHAAYPHELSGGMRQRVVIAMALANDPELLIADEPVTGLDVVTQERILHLLLALQRETGSALLLITHDLPLVARAADQLLVMYAGRVVESGTAAAISAAPAHPYTRQLLHSFPSLRGARTALASIPGDPPDLTARPAGCAFHPRCPDVVDACLVIDPPAYALGGDRRAACLRAVEDAGDG